VFLLRPPGSGCTLSVFTTRRTLRFSRDSCVQRGTAPGDSGEAALFRWESAANPGCVPRNGRRLAPLRARTPVPSGPRAIPLACGARGPGPPGGRGASVRPPCEPPSRPFRRLVHQVGWVDTRDELGSAGGGVKGRRDRIRTREARPGPGSGRSLDPWRGSDTPRPIGLREVPLDSDRPRCVLAPTLPREGPRSPPGALVSSPLVKDRVSPVRPARGTGG